MPRVCMITTNHSPFDDRIFYKEAISLKNAGYDVCVVGRTNSMIKEEAHGIRVVGLKKGEGLKSIPILWKAVADESSKADASIYHCHEPESFLIALYLMFFKGKKIIYDVHEYYVDALAELMHLPIKTFLVFLLNFFILYLIEPFFCQYASAIITADEGIAQRYRKFNDNVTSIFNFPVAELFNQDNYERIKERFGDSFVVVYVGGLSEERGILDAIKAVHKASMEQPRIKLLLIGSFMSKDFEETCLKYVKLNELQDNVEFLGYMPHDDVPKYIKASDVGIALFHPTKRFMKTSYPIKLFEYMICGKPIIVSDFPAMKKVVDDARCGIFVDPTDVDDVSRAMVYATGHPDDLEAMGNRGTEAIKEKYNWRTMEKVLLDVYEKICPIRSLALE